MANQGKRNQEVLSMEELGRCSTYLNVAGLGGAAGALAGSNHHVAGSRGGGGGGHREEQGTGEHREE
jgi:hypothetical protein